MKFYPEFRMLKDAWLASPRAEGCLIPGKKDFQLSKMGRFLPFTMLLETVSPEEISYRVMGSAITNLVNENWQGDNMLDHSMPDVGKALSIHYQLMLKQPAIRYYEEMLYFPSGKKIRSDSMAVPLLDADGAARYLFCVVHFELLGFTDQLYPEDELIANRSIVQLFYEDIGYGQQHRAAGWYLNGQQTDPSDPEMTAFTSHFFAQQKQKQ